MAEAAYETQKTRWQSTQNAFPKPSPLQTLKTSSVPLNMTCFATKFKHEIRMNKQLNVFNRFQTLSATVSNSGFCPGMAESEGEEIVCKHKALANQQRGERGSESVIGNVGCAFRQKTRAGSTYIQKSQTKKKTACPRSIKNK